MPMDQGMRDKGLLTIKQVSAATRVPPSTLRFWEREFREFLVPLRTEGGQRRYRGENLEVIRQIKKLREEGLPIAGIREGLSPREKARGGIDLLAHRVAEAVRAEVYHFFRTGGGDP